MSSTVSVPTTVRTAVTSDIGRLAETLAAAFYDDPVMKWCFPDDDRRAALNVGSFRVILEATLPDGGVHTVTGEVAGSVWLPPDAQLDEEQLAADLGRESAEYAERVYTLLELMNAHHPTHEPHQYLFILGTRPGWQSRGLGSALIRAVLDECDRDGVPAYLEATSEQNRRLYERHGFRMTETLTLPDGPPVFCMWRTPAGVA